MIWPDKQSSEVNFIFIGRLAIGKVRRSLSNRFWYKKTIIDKSIFLKSSVQIPPRLPISLINPGYV